MSIYLLPSDPSLSLPVTRIAFAEAISPKIQEIATRLLQLIGEERGSDEEVMLGLAAPQIGIRKPVIVIDKGASSAEDYEPLFTVYINPELLSSSEKVEEGVEGCFSVDPQLFGIVKRPKEITIKALNQDGVEITEKLSGLVARVFLHELDHLNGVRFPDHAKTLHWVNKEDYPRYRERWTRWHQNASPADWIRIKAGATKLP